MSVPQGNRFRSVPVAPPRGEILIVDDSPENLRILSQLLSDQGYRVRAARGGIQGLRSARVAAPDLILLDVMMPDLDGYQVCSRLKKDPSTQSVPVLFLSGLDSTEDKVRGFEAGGEDYIAKPFEAGEVLARVRTHLARRRAEAALQEANKTLQAQLVEIRGLQAEIRRRAGEEVQRQTALAGALLRTAARLNTWLDLDTVVQVVCEEAAHSMNVPAAAVLLYDESGDQYLLSDLFGLPREIFGHFAPVPRPGYDELAADRDCVVVRELPRESDGTRAELLGQLGVRTTATARMSRDGHPVGLLAVASLDEARAFSDHELAVLKGLADQAAQAIANAQLYQEVRAGRESLRALSLQLMEAQEAERREVARELHDEIGQILTGLKLTLGVSRQLPPGPVATRLAEAREMVEELLGRVRDLSLDLRPSMLDDLGLLPALLWSFDRYTERTGVRVAFKHQGLDGRRFEPRVETAAYRIVQEALTNVARHAGVAEAVVRVWAGQDRLEVQVEDRGAGFTPDVRPSARATGGLAGMRERVNLLGGSLGIESAPGAGTRLSAELPLSSTEGREQP